MPLSTFFDNNRTISLHHSFERIERATTGNVTNPCTTSMGTVNNGPCAWDDAGSSIAAPPIDLSADANWRRYRYRVYETIIPLRNVMWQTF